MAYAPASPPWRIVHQPSNRVADPCEQATVPHAGHLWNYAWARSVGLQGGVSLLSDVYCHECIPMPRRNVFALLMSRTPVFTQNSRLYYGCWLRYRVVLRRHFVRQNLDILLAAVQIADV